jgi:hypothetical protein
MSGGIAVAGIVLFVIFLFGVLFGVLVIVSRAFNREDRRKSLRGTPPDAACSGTRWLVGVSRRDYQQGDYSQRPEEGLGHGWEREG